MKLLSRAKLARRLVLSCVAILAFFYSSPVLAQQPLFLNETNCVQVGTYENGICTLTQDVTSPIYIAVAGLTLDGAGYTLESGGFQDAAIGVQAAGVTVKNLNIVTDARYAVNVTADGDGAQITQVVSQNAFFGTRVLQAEDVVIEDLFLDGGNGNGFGIALSESKDTTINRITAKGGRSGINMFAADRVVIETSSFVENEIGVDIQDTTDVVLSNSTLIANQEAGVNIVRANEIEIVGNTIDFTDSSGQRNGFVINESTEIDSVTVWNNEIIAALIGIDDRTQYDFGGPGDPGGPIQQSFLDSVRQTFLVLRSYLVPTVLAQGVAHITFWNNDFVDVSVAHTISDLAYGIMTLSNGNGTTGNYWSSYDSDDEGCVDDNTDGTCDEPYILPSQNLDGYLPDFAAQTQPVAAVSIEASPTCELTAPSEVSLDEPFTISYTTQDATGGLLPSVGIIDDTDGSITATPDEVGTTIYQLVVWGDGAPSDCEVTVEVVETAAPTGASSVLFLPGIQASRLYVNKTGRTEDQVWEPSINFGQDITDLAMNEAGQSINDIYTKRSDVIDRTNYPGEDLIVYEAFVDRLALEKEVGVIAEYETFAYDWRYDVRDVVTDGVVTGDEENRVTLFPINELVKLADKAPSGRVSIVAHSNGGLLAKAMLQALEKRCADEQLDPCPLSYVDQVIFLGTPQLGTPAAINRTLHGLSGLSVPERLVLAPARYRAAVRNMPGANALLPGEAYFDSVSGPLITFTGTGQYLSDVGALYPNGIRTVSQLQDFLSGAEGRLAPRDADLEEPAILNEFIVRQGLESINNLSGYEIPESIAVTEIVGVGVLTNAATEYDSLLERQCRPGAGCAVATQLTRVRPIMGLYGDETVMALSAAGYQGEKVTYYVDLQKYNASADESELDNLLPAVHSNLTEPSDIQDLVISLISSSSPASSAYVSSQLPEYEGESFDGISTHSPVTLIAEDVSGNRTGVTINSENDQYILEEIPGSSFFMIGSSSYLYIPSDIEYDVLIKGYAAGSFSLILEEVIEGSEQQIRFRAENISSDANTVARFEKTASGFSDLSLDFDNDGVTDEVRTLDGILIVDEAIDIAPDQLADSTRNTNDTSSGASATRIDDRQPNPQVLGVGTSVDLPYEQQVLMDQLLVNIKNLINSTEMTSTEIDQLAVILNKANNIIMTRLPLQ